MAEARTAEFERAATRVERVLDRMAGIFGARDELLRSAGPLVVYYWFVRVNNTNVDPLIRGFLLDFQTQRKRNKRRASDGDENVDADLALYDKFDRSTDNQGSIEGRVEILLSRLRSLPTMK